MRSTGNGMWVGFTMTGRSGRILAIILGAVVALPALAAGPAKAEHYVLVHAGTLLAVPGQPPQKNMTVVIHNDRIERVVPGFLPADGVTRAPDSTIDVIDLSDRFVLPGLIDAHVHLRDQPAFSRHRVERGDRNPHTGAEYAVNAMIYARRTLGAGFTTVRDVGSDDQSVFAVRNAINQGRVIGPHILVSGSILSVTGGHGDSQPIDETGDPQARLRDGTCDGPIECREAVRFNYKLGADVIKFTATGGFSTNEGLGTQLFPDEVQAIIDTAHMLGLKVAVHAYTPTSIKDAIRAGVDSVEHGFLVDDEGIAMMKKAGTYLVPTLSASYPPPIFKIPDPESVKIRNQYKAFERAYKAGVKIAFGTDAGTFDHGTNAKEFGYMVQFGMSPADAIKAATVGGADLLGVTADAGTLAPGKVADLIAVKGDPLSDVSTLMQVDFVMKSGQVAKRDGAMTAPFVHPQ